MSLFATGYLAPISYYAQLIASEEVIIEQMESFPKQTYRNRACIQTANGPLPLIVPISKPYGNHTLTRDIVISYRENWNIQHWRAIETAYNASPYFLYYKDALEKIILTPHEKLIDLNHQILVYILKKLKVNIEIKYSEVFEIPQQKEDDFRWKFSIKEPIPESQFPQYNQVFDDKLPFQPNLSIIDLLFNLGPETKAYLSNFKHV